MRCSNYLSSDSCVFDPGQGLRNCFSEVTALRTSADHLRYSISKPPHLQHLSTYNYPRHIDNCIWCQRIVLGDDVFRECAWKVWLRHHLSHKSGSHASKYLSWPVYLLCQWTVRAYQVQPQNVLPVFQSKKLLKIHTCSSMLKISGKQILRQSSWLSDKQQSYIFHSPNSHNAILINFSKLPDSTVNPLMGSSSFEEFFLDPLQKELNKVVTVHGIYNIFVF